MKPVEPEELSALLDGELDARRAREVALQMQQDPSLRREFDALSTADADWRAAADGAAFVPRVRTPTITSYATDARAAQGGWASTLAIGIGGFIAVRSVLKLAGSDALAIALPVVALLLLIAAVVAMAGGDLRADHETQPRSTG